MPDTETDVGFSDETLTDFEYAENGEKNEGVENTNTYERETATSNNEANSTQENATAITAILEERGGKAEDWAFVDRGNAGYQFDGKDVRGPDGEIWTNPDAALHEAMLESWREGESSVFLLPDYMERTEDKETLYITTLILDSATGTVGWEIHAHETPILKDEEVETRASDNTNTETHTVRWEEMFEEIAPVEEREETIAGTLAAAEQIAETTESTEVSGVDDQEFESIAPSIGNASKRDMELGALLKNIFTAEPLEAAAPDDSALVEKESFTRIREDEEEAAEEIALPDFEKELPLPETKAETIFHALGIPLPSPIQPRKGFRSPLPGFKPKTSAQPKIEKRVPGETVLKGIRMRRAQ
ncbi:hypothetical protein C4568_02585 [Candidatus Parcubacteria bacterium]|nr:MAG: hypothetical protein C4568_02585 [Candidatus Parcubacteria bacterium]